MLAAALAAALVVTAPPARAQAPRVVAGRDTVAIDSLAARSAKPAATAADTAAMRRRLPWREQPRVVMLRSLLVPGWGQWHNRSYVKSLAVAGLEGWIIAGILRDQGKLDGLLAAVDTARAHGSQSEFDVAVNRYNDRLDRYVGGQWLLAGVLAYALVDAYVDAHFRTFDLDFRNDPALPPDEIPDATPSKFARPGRSARLSLRWHF